MKQDTIYIDEMCCENEAQMVKACVQGVNGVSGCEANLVSRTLKVSYDPAVLSLDELIAAIDKTGMKAALQRAGKAKQPDMPWWKQPRLFTLLICGFFIFAGFVTEVILSIPHGQARLLYAIAILVGGYYPAKMGLTALKTLTPNIRTLMVVGAVGALILGLWEESALLVFIYSLGDVLEAYATDRVRGSVRALMGLAPKDASVRKNGGLVTINVDEIGIGDIVIIKPGERIPLDGEVISGNSSVNQAPITGESMPVSKVPGDEVFAGSINQRGSLEVRVSKPFQDTTLGRIIHYVEEAESRKSGYQRFGETFGRYYTPFMFALAIVVMVLPSIIFGNFPGWFYRGLVVLVVSCSCGIALSIPVSVVAAISNAARHGVLIKGGVYLELAGHVKAIAFDKTGSLTVGRPVVTDVIPFGGATEESVLSLASSIESLSEHILSDAIISRAKELGISIKDAEGFEAFPGVGARALIEGRPYCIGNSSLCAEPGNMTTETEKKIQQFEEEGKTLVFLTRQDELLVKGAPEAGVSGELLGIIATRDEIRPEAEGALKRLKEMGVTGLVMLTGDNEHVARVIAEKAGISEYVARLHPEDKVKAISGLRREYGLVAMVGDGVNDAPAMVESNLGIAMGAAGTDVAIETGDIVLMSDDLTKIPYVLNLSRRTVSNIRQNIAFSLIIIGFLVPVALIGWIGLVPGILINEAGGLLVIINGLRLLR
ncbi:MAG: cation-translocating P-type ATPase [Nitrospirae bacterium]|nr:cation-translocating P-type ATPase [Nitrospirota bacterium]